MYEFLVLTLVCRSHWQTNKGRVQPRLHSDGHPPMPASSAGPPGSDETPSSGPLRPATASSTDAFRTQPCAPTGRPLLQHAPLPHR